MNGAEADNVIRKVSTLVIEDVLAPAAGAEAFKSDPALVVTLTLQDNSTRTYSFAKPDKENFYLMKSSAHDLLFKVSEAVANELNQVARTALVKAKAAAAETAAPEAAPAKEE